jgi:hypothetical protein
MKTAIEAMTPRMKVRVIINAMSDDHWEMRGSPQDPEYYNKSWEDVRFRERCEKIKIVSVDMNLVVRLFLDIRSHEDALQFYQRTLFPERLSFSQIPYFQGLIRQASNLAFSRWSRLRKHFLDEDVEKLMEEARLKLVWEKGAPVLECEADWLDECGIAGVFGTFLQVAQLCGMRQRFCERRGCQRTINEHRRRDARFCERKCATLAAREKKKSPPV